MKKLYFLVFVLLLPLKSVALYNFVAADDYVQVPAHTSGVVIVDILQNDLDGYTGFGFDEFATPVNAADVSITLLSQSSAMVFLQGRSVVVSPGTPEGVYTISYLNCRYANGACTAPGTITVKVGGSVLAAPTLSYSQQFPCGSSSELTISGLPSGAWVIDILRSGTWHKSISGSGPTYTATAVDITEGHEYRVRVTDLSDLRTSALSAPVILPEYTCNYAIEVIPSYVDYNNDGILSVGDRVNYSLTISNVVDAGFIVHDVVVWGQLESVSVAATMPGFTPFSTETYREVTEREVRLGVMCTVGNVMGSFGASTLEQTFVNVFYLPALQSLSGAVLSGHANCGGHVSLSVSLAGGIPPYTVVYSDGTTDFTIVGYTGGDLVTQVSEETTFTLVAAADANGNPAPSISGSVQAGLVNDGFELVAFVDFNANGVMDADEPPFTAGIFGYTINDGPDLALASSLGMASICEQDPDNTYDFSYTFYDPTYCELLTPLPQNVSVPAGSGVTPLFFAVSVTPHADVSVDIIPYGAVPRAGFTHHNLVKITNHGNGLASGSLAFESDAAQTIVALSEAIPFSAQGFDYGFSDLAPQTSIVIDMTLLVGTLPAVSIGQLMQQDAVVTLSEPDSVPVNNHDSLTQVITGAYDPNNKTERHGPKIIYDDFNGQDELAYTLNFENTGTASATNIRLEDELDLQLDENTVRVVASSHDYTMQRDGSHLTWRFDDVQLPVSTPDTMDGHGFVTFTVKLKPGYAVGDIVPNTASIYFDFNPAILTNTWETEFVETLRTTSIVQERFKAYPNPVHGRLFIRSGDTGQIDHIVLTDCSGKTVYEASPKQQETILDMSGLESGLYFAKITGGGQNRIIKVIKQ